MKSPVRENCTPGSVRGLSGNWQSYRDLQSAGNKNPNQIRSDDGSGLYLSVLPYQPINISSSP
jgi:hypothetical protein